jgi:5-methyltetrahydropteroyltriglutamate--homocysteine methyltransferase
VTKTGSSSCIHEVQLVINSLPDNKVLSLGVVNGRNIWKTDLSATLLWLEPIHQQLQDRLWLAPSCQARFKLSCNEPK